MVYRKSKICDSQTLSLRYEKDPISIDPDEDYLDIDESNEDEEE